MVLPRDAPRPTPARNEESTRCFVCGNEVAVGDLAVRIPLAFLFGLDGDVCHDSCLAWDGKATWAGPVVIGIGEKNGNGRCSICGRLVKPGEAFLVADERSRQAHDRCAGVRVLREGRPAWQPKVVEVPVAGMPPGTGRRHGKR